jgi:hypothetical protein
LAHYQVTAASFSQTGGFENRLEAVVTGVTLDWWSGGARGGKGALTSNYIYVHDVRNNKSTRLVEVMNRDWYNYYLSLLILWKALYDGFSPAAKLVAKLLVLPRCPLLCRND